MMIIPLTQGQHALVDDDDFERLSKYKWCAQKTRHGDYYAVRQAPAPDLGVKGGRMARRKIYMHREILGFNGETDHRNRNKLDNRKENLRPASHSQNMSNRSKAKWHISKFKGVTWHSRNKKWQASIKVNRTNKYIGQFDHEHVAAMAYDSAAIVEFGDFAVLNFTTTVLDTRAA